jgi:putative endonuclease
MMKDYYVYMLLCADGSFYVGITNDLALRVGQHQFGCDRASYTFSRHPVTVVYAADFHDVNQAIASEKQIKGWSRAKKRALIGGNWPLIHSLAACANGTAHYNFDFLSSFDCAQDDMSLDCAQDDMSLDCAQDDKKT